MDMKIIVPLFIIITIIVLALVISKTELTPGGTVREMIISDGGGGGGPSDSCSVKSTTACKLSFTGGSLTHIPYTGTNYWKITCPFSGIARLRTTGTVTLDRYEVVIPYGNVYQYVTATGMKMGSPYAVTIVECTSSPPTTTTTIPSQPDSCSVQSTTACLLRVTGESLTHIPYTSTNYWKITCPNPGGGIARLRTTGTVTLDRYEVVIPAPRIYVDVTATGMVMGSPYTVILEECMS